MDTVIFDFEIGLEIVFRTTVIFLYAFLLLRLLGKRHLSHLMYTDLLVIIAFGSAVGDVMIYGENEAHLISSILAITVVAVIVKILEEVSSRNTMVGKFIEGQARLLIDKGSFVKGALGKENMSEETVLSLLREKNIENVKSVKKAFIEPDGELSVITYKK